MNDETFLIGKGSLQKEKAENPMSVGSTVNLPQPPKNTQGAQHIE